MNKPLSLKNLVRSSGFTLIELLVTITVLAILLGIGVPSFHTFILSQRVKSSASEISSMLVLARSEAIKRNRNVDINPATGGWQNGWTVSVTSGGTTTSLNQHEPFHASIAIANAAANLAYDSNGRLTGGAGQFTVQSIPATQCATIRITASGMPSKKIVSC